MRCLPVVAVVALAGLASCGSSSPTAARVFFDLGEGVAIDQVRLEAAVAGVTLLSTDVPAVARGEIRPGQDVVVLFEDRLAGLTIDLLAAGRLAGAEVARGQSSVTLRGGRTVSTFVTLAQSVGCPAGQHQCTDACYPDDDPGHCGLSCLTCSGPTHGQATCVTGACSFSCDQGYTRCGIECVDLKSDSRNCNACARSCQPNQLCQAGECVLNSCPTGQHACGGTCVSSLDPATCGSRCDPCPIPPHGSATCDGTGCGIACSSGYHVCSGSCASSTSPASCGTRCTPCPTVPNSDASCNGTSCTYACTTGYHACGSTCVSNLDPATCGDSCSPCPAPPDHAVVTCDGTNCGYSCQAGYHDCGGWCQVNGQGCDVCPPCVDPQKCYPAAGICFTPGYCSGNDECVSGVCQSNVCACSMLTPPLVGCRPFEECLFVYCMAQQ
ncbi:MAG: hypothetical protein HY906_24380 [Deltaproteobacteria bacterium]|nr:hypothetical protein [Deltaproteobacteria bacterium]